MLDSVARFEETSKAIMHLAVFFLESTQNKAMCGGLHSLVTQPGYIFISGKEEQAIANSFQSFGGSQQVTRQDIKRVGAFFGAPLHKCSHEQVFHLFWTFRGMDRRSHGVETCFFESSKERGQRGTHVFICCRFGTGAMQSLQH